MSTARSKANAWFNQLDYLRFFAVLWVVGYWHLAGFVTHQGDRYWLSGLTQTGLGLLTLTSGYLAHRKGWPASSRRFLLQRFVRLYPLFAITVVLYYVLGVYKIDAMWKMLSLLAVAYGPPYPLTLWFVVMLFNFDIWYAVVASLRRFRFRWLFYACLVAGIALYSVFVHSFQDLIFEYGTPFVIGVLLASGRLKRLYATIAAAVVLPVAVYVFDQHLLWKQARYTLLIVSASLLVSVIAEAVHRPNPVDKVFRWLAYCTFGMYLFHRLVYIGLKDLWMPHGRNAGYAYLWTVGIGLVILASWVVQTGYDQLVDKIGAALRGRRPHQTPQQPGPPGSSPPADLLPAEGSKTLVSSEPEAAGLGD
jgi:peptidoglycan/LPS O-acetylase OafA/YrhL